MLIISEAAEAVEAHRKGRRVGEFNKSAVNNSTDANFPRTFELIIKDTLEDEVADTYIRLLDLARHWEFEFSTVEAERQAVKNIVPENFAEGLLLFSGDITDIYQEHMNAANDKIRNGFIAFSIEYLERFAVVWGIDLDYHVEAKLRYNQTRPYKHGKAY